MCSMTCVHMYVRSLLVIWPFFLARVIGSIMRWKTTAQNGIATFVQHHRLHHLPF